MGNTVYDGAARMSAIERRRTDYRPPDDHNRLADDALLELWTICEQSADAPDADLPGMRNRWFEAIDTYRAERHRSGHKRHSNGRGGLVRDPVEPEMPDRIRAAAGLAVSAMSEALKSQGGNGPSQNPSQNIASPLENSA